MSEAAGRPAPQGTASQAWQQPVEEAGYRWLPHALLAAVAGFFVVGFLWAAFAEIDEVARGEGRVIPSSQVQLIQNLEGGILSQVLVKEGQLVEKDQMLFRIDDTRFASAYREGQAGRLALQARIARLEAEANRGTLKMPEAVRRGNPEVARQEQAAWESRRRDLAGKNEIFRQQLAQRQSELRELQSRAERLAEAQALIAREISLTAPLVKQGIVSEVELLRQERESVRVRTDLEGARLALPRVEAAIEEAKRRVEDNEQAFRSQAAADLAQAQAEFAKLDAGLPALEDRANRTAVRSPMRGVVKLIPMKTVGGVIQPGTTMAEIVPAGDTLLVEARIRPSDIAFVRVGQQAVVKLTAYDYSIFGGLAGRIEHVSADSVQPQQGEPYFIAHVRTDAAALAYRDRSLPVIPGMTATVDVLTGKRTVLYYLLKPINRTRDRALTER